MFKSLISVILNVVQQDETQDHKRAFYRFMAIVVGEIVLFTALFHLIMLYEGRDYSIVTGLYWTFTVMSTLGFGDVIFHSDVGKLFSIVVLVSGIVFFLILLPFTFIQHFYLPWLERQKKDKVQRRLPETMTGHVLIAGTNPLALNLAASLSRYDMKVFLLSSDLPKAQELLSAGYKVVFGEYDDKETYRRLHADTARALVVMDRDIRSANIVFSAHEAAPDLNIVAGVESLEARDILRMAGCGRCFHFYSLLGEALARRVINPSQCVSVLGHFGELVVAEAPVMRTPLAGRTLLTSGIRQDSGVSVVGVWTRGVFSLPRPDMTFGRSTVLMVAGTREQVEAFNRMVSTREEEDGAAKEPPVIIIGGGRVGVAVARSLVRRGMNALIVDRQGSKVDAGPIPVLEGDASDLAFMEKAGIRSTPALIVTTHDDDANIYLTIYCRRIRPDAQIISRASLDKNVNGLHLAGADHVLSLASLISATVVNLLSPKRVLMLNERLSVFSARVEDNLDGLTLVSSGIRAKTHCSVLSVHAKDGQVHVNPPADQKLARGDTLYLIGDDDARRLYKENFGIGADEGAAEEAPLPKWQSESPERKQGQPQA